MLILGTTLQALYTTAPCYCSTPDESGISACFDFTGATSDVSCNPTGICALSTAQPDKFGIQLGGPIYLVRARESDEVCHSSFNNQYNM